jgi:hypothetical protein
MRIVASVALVGLVVGSPTVAAQSPDLSGTWRLDRKASQINTSAGLAGMGSNGIVDVLHITHAANDTVTIGSQINESQARLYRPGGTSPAPDSRGNHVTVTSRWDGATLVAEGPQRKEAFSLDRATGTLTVRVTTGGEGETATSTLVYSRLDTLGPCESWPTPCR